MKTLINKRPSERTPEIIEAAVNMLMPTVWDWVTASSSTENYPTDEREAARLELIKAVNSSTRGFDGYDLAINGVALPLLMKEWGMTAV